MRSTPSLHQPLDARYSVIDRVKRETKVESSPCRYSPRATLAKVVEPDRVVDETNG